MRTTPELIAKLQMYQARYDDQADWKAGDHLADLMRIYREEIIADLIELHGIAAKFAPSDKCALQAAVDRFSPRDIR